MLVKGKKTVFFFNYQTPTKMEGASQEGDRACEPAADSGQDSSQDEVVYNPPRAYSSALMDREAGCSDDDEEDEEEEPDDEDEAFIDMDADEDDYKHPNPYASDDAEEDPYEDDDEDPQEEMEEEPPLDDGRRHRRWAFTEHYPSDVEAGPKAYLETADLKGVTYLVVGLECSPSTGKWHLQGYVEFRNDKSLAATRAAISDTAHFEAAFADGPTNAVYCKKDGDFAEFGEIGKTGQGKRNDLDAIYEMAKDDKTLREIADAYPSTYMRNYRAVAHVKLMMAPPRDFMPEVYVIWGPTGVGKSKHCYETAPGAFFKPRGDWWDKFDGNQDVVIDEFYGWLPWDELLRICDRYPHQVQTKGGYVNFAAKRIFITSNNSPTTWYKNKNIKFSTFARRVTQFMWIHTAGQFYTFDGNTSVEFMQKCFRKCGDLLDGDLNPIRQVQDSAHDPEEYDPNPWNLLTK